MLHTDLEIAHADESALIARLNDLKSKVEAIQVHTCTTPPDQVLDFDNESCFYSFQEARDVMVLSS